ncbi:MAG: glycosyltransferase [Paludibacter sp.]|nr:glycosyltransferase [Paludibacter sp.]
MKVIHYIQSIGKHLGGVTAYMELLSKELGKKVELVIVTGEYNNEPVILQNSKTIFFKQRKSDLLSLLTSQTLLSKEFNRILIEEKPDIVHINGIWLIHCWIFQREAQKLGIRVIISPHGMLEPWILSHHRLKKQIAFILYQKKALRQCDNIHATATAELDNIKKLGFDVPIYIAPNGIEVSNIPLKDSWSKRKTLLFLSRIHPKKGIENLIEAVSNLKELFKDYAIIIAGSGDTDYVDSLKNKTSILGVSHLFKFAGNVYGEEKWNLFRNSDVFVLPTKSENFGIVVAESLACGTPVLTTTGTPWEELTLNQCGWWIEPDVSSIEEGLKEILELNDDQLKKMGLNGRKLILEKYSSLIMTEKMIQIYDNCKFKLINTNKLEI